MNNTTKETLAIGKQERVGLQEVHLLNPRNEFTGTFNLPSENGQTKNLAEILNTIQENIGTGGGGGSVERVVGSGCVGFLPKYIRQIEFQDSYESDAEWYYEQAEEIGYCSARRRGQTLERNYDWYFDESCEFVVSMAPGLNSDGSTRFGSVGVASVGTKLTEKFVASGKWSRYFKCLPGMTLDGINEKGVAAEINVVPANGADWESRSGTRTLNALGGVRWILDHASTAEEAADHIAAHAYIPQALSFKHGYSLHFMICDGSETWVVEDGVAHRINGGSDAIMTNFRLFDPDGSFFKDTGFRETYGAGYERYGILERRNSTIKDVWYTNAYRYDNATDQYPWLSEFAGCPYVDNPDSPIPSTDTEALKAWTMEHIYGKTPTRETGTWWQTVHTSIYDLERKTLKVAVQEIDDWYVFQCPVGAGSSNEPPVVRPDGGKRDCTDFRVWKKVSEDWVWSKNTTASADIPASAQSKRQISAAPAGATYHMVECPQEFLDFANASNAPKLRWHEENGEWGNVNMFHPNGKPKYVITLKTAPKNQSQIVFYFFVVNDSGVDTGEMFSAIATRARPTDDSIYAISGDDMPLGQNEFQRIATTDYIDKFYARKKTTDIDAISQSIDDAETIDELKSAIKRILAGL